MKKSLVFVLALMLVVAFASSAMAAQVQVAVYGGTVTPLATSNKTFQADGISNYPYEVYLPSEQNANGYRIHSNYTKSTDACASCHATHTAVGNALLQWYSAYETCMACHDGTVSSTYDVARGVIGQTAKPAMGGAFTDTGNSGSASNHNVTGVMENAAAPGGSVIGKTFSAQDASISTFIKEDITSWEVEFGCESCHTPHGMGGNARILHPDANGAATQRAADKGWMTNGIRANVYGTLAASDALVIKYPSLLDKPYFAYVPVAGDATGTLTDEVYSSVMDSAYGSGNGFYFLKKRPYATTVNGFSAGDPGASSSTKWISDNSLGYTRLIYNGAYDATISDAAYKANVQIKGVPALRVTMKIINYLGYANTTEEAPSVTEGVYHGTGMNQFCGACHTDYNTMSAENWGGSSFGGSSERETGVYSKAHRHQVGYSYSTFKPGLAFEGATGFATGKMVECLTCHVAHGVNKDFWQDSLVDAGVVGPDYTLWQTTDLVELSGSSALKRMPNMGTCEACHAKELGNDGYMANTGEVANAPFPAANTVDPVTNIEFSIGDNIAALKAAGKLDWVGSAKCEPCHAEAVTGWKENRHYNGSSSDHTSTTTATGSCSGALATNWDGTVMNCHFLGYFAQGKPSKASGSTFYRVSSADFGQDAYVTCEACHGSGRAHISAPTKLNIYNPAAPLAGEVALDTFKRNVLYCGNCHARENRLAYGPTATVEQLFSSTNHESPYGYASSMHYKSGIVGCTTCHDTHKGDTALKVEYKQLCASCHDTAANPLGGVLEVMGAGTNPLDHSFSFGLAGQYVTAADPAATATILHTQLSQNGHITAAQAQYTGRAQAVLKLTKGVLGTPTYIDYYRTGATDGTWTLESKPAAAILTTDYTFDATKGRVSFVKTGTAANLVGTWTVKWVSTNTPTLTATGDVVIVD